jgi:hypothetical protein
VGLHSRRLAVVDRLLPPPDIDCLTTDLQVVGELGDGPAGFQQVEDLRSYRVPSEVLTDNGKQFTGRFADPVLAEVLFERACREHGIIQRLTTPRSPTSRTSRSWLRDTFLFGARVTGIWCVKVTSGRGCGRPSGG